MPKVHVTLEIDTHGPDGNAYVILGKVKSIFKQTDNMHLWEEFHKKATSGNYDHLKEVCKEYVDFIDTADYDDYDDDDYDDYDFGGDDD